MHFLGSTYGRRPSEFLGIDDEWAAYQLDMVTLIVGKETEALMWQNTKQTENRPVKVATKADLMMLGIGVNSV